MKRKVYNKNKPYYIYCYNKENGDINFYTSLDENIAIECIKQIYYDLGLGKLEKYEANQNNKLGLEIGEYSENYLFYNKNKKMIIYRKADEKLPDWSIKISELEQKFIKENNHGKLLTKSDKSLINSLIKSGFSYQDAFTKIKFEG